MVEIHSWHITDSWPAAIPVGGLQYVASSSVLTCPFRPWLEALALPEYIDTFYSQRYSSVQEVINLSWEDLEDIGIKRLGHLKRILLAAKKIKVHSIYSKDYLIPTLQEHRNSAAVVADNMKYITTPIQVQSPRLQARPMEAYAHDIVSPR